MDADWNDYVAKDIALGIGKQAGYACLQGAVVGAGMSIATKVWNGESIDGEEVVETAIVSVGGFIGGTVGYMAGSKVGQAVVKGVQKVRDKAVEIVKSVGHVVVSGIKSLARGLASLLGF